MKNKRLTFSGLFFLALFAFACSTAGEDEEEPVAALDAAGNMITKVEDGSIAATDSMIFRTLLTDSVSKTWNTSLFTLGGSTTFTNCRLDDVMLFFTDGTYTYQGGQLCGAEDNQQNRDGSWEIDYTNRLIIFDKGTSNEYTAEVIGLQEDELRVKGSYMGMEVRGLYVPQ